MLPKIIVSVPRGSPQGSIRGAKRGFKLVRGAKRGFKLVTVILRNPVRCFGSYQRDNECSHKNA